MTTRVQVTVPPGVNYVVKVMQEDWTPEGESTVICGHWKPNIPAHIMFAGTDEVFYIHETRRLVVEELPVGSKEDND